MRSEEVSARRVLKDTASHKASPLGQGLRSDKEQGAKKQQPLTMRN